MTDPQPTFASEADPSETRWHVPFRFGTQTIQVPVTATLIRSEIRDQASVKGSNRKGVLRTTRKRLAALLKSGPDNLSEQARGEMEWNAFILLVDEVIANRHMAVRTDAQAVEQIAADPRLTPPEQATPAADGS
jgi:hypothetical protein